MGRGPWERRPVAWSIPHQVLTGKDLKKILVCRGPVEYQPRHPPVNWGRPRGRPRGVPLAPWDKDRTWMTRLAPIASRGAAALACGLTAAAGGRVIVGLAGAVPAAVAAMVAGGAAALAIGAAWPAADADPPKWGPRAAAAAMPLVFVLLAPMLTTGLGRVGLAPTATPLVVGALWGVSLVPLARRLAGAIEAARGQSPAVAAVGVVIGVALPAWGAALLAGGAALLVTAPSAPSRDAPPADSVVTAAALAAIGAASLPMAAAVRAVVAPAADGLAAFIVAALLGLAIGRMRSPRTAGRRLMLAGAGLAGLALLQSVAAGLARDLVMVAPGAGIDPRSLLVLPPAGLGLAVGIVGGLATGRVGRPVDGAAWAAGLAIGATLAPPIPWILGGLGGATVLATSDARRRGLGLLLIAGSVALALRGPTPSTEAAVGAWRLLQDPEQVERDALARATQRTAGGACAPAGCWTVRADDAAFAPDDSRPASPPWTAELDGALAQSRGRDADAERMAGLLGGALRGTSPVDRALLLGDTTARALEPLLDRRPGLVTVSVPSPALVQTAAPLDDRARDAWLHPAVQLWSGSAEAVLRASREQDLILEIVRAPWRDAAHGVPDPEHLDAVQARLAPGGHYILVLHLRWWGAGGPAQVAADVAARFDSVQIWLPPTGVDSLILVAGDAPPRLDRFLTGALLQSDRMAALGLPGADILASFAIGDRATARTWGADRGRPWSPWRLSAAVGERPRLHLDTLADRVAAPAAIWDLTGRPFKDGILESRLEARATFLRLLGEAARGDMGDVFEAARRLVSQEGAVATQALSVLIEPHMDQARKALFRAQIEGATSSGWQEAQRFATTARMLSPRSPEPALLLADIALEQKNFNAAVELYEGVLELSPADLAALNGLARTARARRDLDAAERYLQEATTAHGQDWTTWQRLGALRMEKGDGAGAEQALRRASSLAGPTRPEPHVALGELYLQLERPTTALVHAERAVQLDGGSRAWFVRGRAHLALGELDRAAQDFRKATELDGAAIAPWEGTAMVRGLQGDLPGAAEALRTLLTLAPDHDVARENLRRIDDQLRAERVVGPDGRPTGP